MVQHITPALDPLPKQTSTYRDGHGRLRRLTVVSIPREEPDWDRFVDALLKYAMAKVEEDQRQVGVTRDGVEGSRIVP